MSLQPHLSVFMLCVILTQCITAATIELTGLPEGKVTELVAKITPRMEFIKTRDATSWRADDASFFLKRLLIREGHPEAQVTWSLPGNNRILLHAKPGPKYLFGKISSNRLEGITQDELTQYFLQPIIETEEVSSKHAPFIEEYIEKGISNVENYLKSQGYWQASVQLAKKSTLQAQHKINISLRISNGPLFRIATPHFSQTSKSDRAAISHIVHPLLGQPANTTNITLIRNEVEKHYLNHGFHTAKVRMGFRHHNGLTHLTFSVQSGKVWHISDVKVAGNIKTKDRRIRRYFDDLRGKPFDAGKADQSLKKLLATGAFKSAKLVPIPIGANQIDLRVDVAEARARSLRSYAGFGSYEGFIVGASYTDLNFLGRLYRYNTRAEFSNRGLLGEMSLTEPHFASEPIQFTTRGYILQRTYDGYSKKEAGVESSFTWHPQDQFTSRLYLGASYVSSSSTKLTPAELGPDDYLHTRIGFEQTLDLRDSGLLPTKGLYLKGSIQYGSISGDASTGYLLAQLDSSYRIPIGDHHGLTSRFSTGILEPENDSNLPIDLRLFSGGSDSVRSFDQRQLGPRSLSNDPLGGQAYWNASLEYLHSINDPIKGVIFLDAGQVYSNAGDWGFSRPSYALGLGLRLDLPIGPVRLEYGRNLNRQRGEPSGTFHFTIGLSF